MSSITSRARSLLLAILILGGSIPAALVVVAPPSVAQAPIEDEPARWEEPFPSPFTRGGVAGMIHGALYVALGGKGGLPDEQVSSELHRLDPTGWMQLASAPFERAEAAGAVVDGKLYVVGGWSVACPGGQCLEVDVYDPITGMWSQSTPAPTPRLGAVAFAVGSSLHVTGGYDCSSTCIAIASTDVLDVASGVWSEGAAMPFGLAYASATTAGAMTWVAGGMTGEFVPSDAIFRFDADLGSWIADGSLPSANSFFSFAACSTKLVIVGGMDTWGERGTFVRDASDSTAPWSLAGTAPYRIAFAATATDGTEMHVVGAEGGDSALAATYDCGSEGLVDLAPVETPAVVDTWEERAPPPDLNVDQPAAAVLGDKLYLIGGYNAQASYVYDPATDLWATFAAPPEIRGGGHALPYGDKVLFLGGDTCDFCTATYLYDPATNEWSSGPAHPPLVGFAAASTGSTVVITGGYEPGVWTVVNKTYLLAPGATEWVETAPSPATGRREHTAFAIGDTVYVAGGHDITGVVQSVETFDVATGIWGLASDLPAPRFKGQMGSCRGDLLFVGGYFDDSNEFLHDEVFRYDATLDTWTELEPMPRGRAFGAGSYATSSAGVHLVGGYIDEPNGFGNGITKHDLFHCGLLSSTPPEILGLPDLVVTDVSMPEEGVQQGHSVALQMTVENRGSGRSGRGWASISLVTYPQQFPELAPGESAVVDFGKFHPEEGYQNYTATVDAFDHVEESRESNNAMTGTSFVEPLPTRCQEPGPDARGYTCQPTAFELPEIEVLQQVDLTSMASNSVGPFPIGFDFPFYGIPRTQFWLTTFGTVSFLPPNPATLDQGSIAPVFDGWGGTRGTVDVGHATIDGEDALVLHFLDLQVLQCGSGDDVFVVLLASGKIRVVYDGFTAAGQCSGFIRSDAGPGGLVHFDASSSGFYLDGIAVEYAPGPTPGPGPDLAILSLTPSTTSAGSAGPVEFTARVANLGTVDAGAFDVTLYDADDHPLDTAGVDFLAAGGLFNVFLTWASPPEGASVVDAFADSGTEVAESIETNNQASALHFVPPAADLLIETLRVVPAAPVEQEPLLFVASVHNAGEVPSSPTILSFLFREGNDLRVIDVVVAAVLPQSSVQVEGSWPDGLPQGAYAALAEIRPVPYERDQTNNAKGLEFDVGVANPGPDLVVDIDAVPEEPDPYSQFQIEGVVINIGDEDAPPSVVHIEHEFGTAVVQVPWISPEERYEFSLSWQASSQDDMEFVARADAEGWVFEGNEQNNEDTLIVPFRSAELRMTKLETSPGIPAVGDLTTFRATIVNDGGYRSEPGWTRFILDGSDFALIETPSIAPGATWVVEAGPWVATGGVHFLTALANAPPSSTYERNFDDNSVDQPFVVVLQALIQPELVLLDIRIDPADPTADDTIVATAVVGNQAAVPATQFEVAFSIDNMTAIGTASVTALAPGQVVEVTSSPWPVGGVPFAVVARADSSGKYREIDESDNVRAEPTVPKAPDLVIEELAATPFDPRVGETATFAARVKNAGDHLAHPGEIQFTLDGAPFGAAVATPELAPGASVVLTPAAWPAVRGTHVLGAAADVGATSDESNEANNGASIEFLVLHHDLVVDAIKIQPPTATAGQSVQISAIVRNLAPDATAPTHARFLVDGVELGVVSVDPIDGESFETISAPSWIANSGMHAIRVIADPQYTVRESNESNNAIRGLLPVGPEQMCATPGPDSFGYTCRQAPYDFKDISWTGTIVSVSDNTVSSAQPIGFAFPFYGSERTSLRVAPNGFLSFSSSGTGCCSGQSLPNPATPNDLIAGYWEDLLPGLGTGKVRRQVAQTADGGASIVQFTNVPHNPANAAPSTFQFQLFPSGDIRVQYQSALSDGGNHGAGIENAAGTTGLRWAYGNWQQSLTGVEYRAPRAERADLRVVALNVDAPSPQAGDIVPVSVLVMNEGSAVAEGVTVRVSVDGATVGDILVPALGPGASTSLPSVSWTASGGSRTLSATIDVMSVVPESNEANNALSIVQYVRWPDLTIQSHTIAPQPVIGGERAYFNATVWNRGDGDTRATTRGEIVLVSPWGYGRTFNIPPIPAGATWNFSFEVAAIHGGDYMFYWSADKPSVIAEQDETNNGAQGPFHVQGPDLVVPDIAFLPANPVHGDVVTLTARVQNQGERAALPSELRFVVDGAALPDVATPALAVGAFVDVIATWPATLGNHTITAFAAAEDTIYETYRGNNGRTQALRVTQADLVLESLTATPMNPQDADAVTLTARVRNVGDAAAPAVVRFELSGATIGEASLAALAAGAAADLTLSWTAIGGDPTIHAIADPTGAILERSETNNERTLALHVRQANYAPTELSIAPADPVHGDALVLSASVANTGDADGAPILVRFLVDGANVGESRVSVPAGAAFAVTATTRAAGGDHVARVEVDAASEVREANEADNAATVGFHVRQADLAAGALVASPASPAHGDPTTLAVEVVNAGDADAGAFVVRFFEADAIVGETPVPALASGGSVVIETTWIADGGDRDLRAVIDATNDVDERNEADNEASTLVHVRQAQLVAEAFTADPASPVHGEATVFHLIVRNGGDAEAAPAVARFLVDGALLGEVSIPSLAPGATAELTSPTWPAVGGERAIRAILDPAGVVAEADETDNVADLALHVRQIDLRAGAIATDPTSPAHGENATFSVDVANEGDAPAPAFVVRFTLDGATLADVTVDGLAVGATASVHAPAWFARGGDHAIAVTVDPSDAVPESDASDNAASRSLHVRQANLLVSALTPTASDPAQGDAIAFRVTVMNAGDASAPESSVRVDLDGAAYATLAVPALGAGASVTLTTANWTAVGGSHILRATADSAAVVEEASETDNARTATFHVRQPDLVVTDITYTPTIPTRGSTMTFRAVVTNQGTSTATNFRVHFRIGADTDLGNALVVTLAPGQSITVQAEESWKAATGLHTVVVKVDRYDTVRESSETNNELSELFAVA